MVRYAVIGELDIYAVTCERYAIEFNRRHPAHTPCGFSTTIS